MHINCDVRQSRREEAGYLEISGSHLYTVLHIAADPAARVLLVGPFAAERHYSYIPWVQWARFLAAKGIEVLRYDYRGVGESTGVFGDMTFDDWCEDVTFLSSWLKARSPDAPVILHGLELGALLAGKAFAAGAGDALITWAAPQTANEVLRAALLRRVAVDQMFNGLIERKTFSEYVQRLDIDPIEVEGYQLRGKLWRDSLTFESHLASGEKFTSNGSRPKRDVVLDKRAAPLVKGSTMGYMMVNPDLSELFADNCDWIMNSAVTQRDN